ncbi:MAG: hypothetical protein MHM6MM_007304, partial [Cercozoa sp. M6MM]
ASSPSPVSSCSEQDGVRFRRLSLDTVSTASSVSTSVSTSVSSHFADLTTPTHALGTRKEEEAVLGFKRPISAAAKKQKLRTLRHRQRWRGFLFCLLHERFRKFAPSLVYTLLTSRPLLVVGDDADTVSATVSALAHLLPGVSMLANHVPLWNQPVSNDSTSSSSDSVNHIDHISRIDGVPLRLRQVPAPTLDDMARHRLIGITRGSFDRLVMRRRSVRESIALLDLDENSLLAPEYPVRYFANGGGSKVGGTGSTGDGGTGQHRKRSLVLQLLGRASRFPNESTFLLFLERHLLGKYNCTLDVVCTWRLTQALVCACVCVVRVELQLKAFVYWHMALQGIEPSQLSQRLQRYARPASTSNKVVLDRSVMEKLLSVGRPDLAILENLARVLLHQQQLHAAGVSLFAQLRGLPVQTKLRIPTLLLPHELHRTRKDEGSPNHAT